MTFKCLCCLVEANAPGFPSLQVVQKYLLQEVLPNAVSGHEKLVKELEVGSSTNLCRCFLIQFLRTICDLCWNMLSKFPEGAARPVKLSEIMVA